MENNEILNIVAKLIEKPFILIIVDETEGEEGEEELTVSISKMRFGLDQDTEKEILENVVNI